MRGLMGWFWRGGIGGCIIDSWTWCIIIGWSEVLFGSEGVSLRGWVVYPAVALRSRVMGGVSAEERNSVGATVNGVSLLH